MGKAGPRGRSPETGVREQRDRAPGIGQMAAILGLALALRLLYVFSIRHAYFFDHLQTEPLRYHEWATLILDASSVPGPPFDQAPGYAYLVAGIYRLLGRSVAAVVFVQAVLGAIACGLLALIGGRLFGRRVGLIAGVIAAIYAPFIYFVGEVEPTTSFLCAVLLAMAAGLSARRSEAVGSWLLAAALWGVALALRAEAVLAFPFVALDAWIRGGRRALWRTAVPLVLVLATIATVNTVIGRKLVFLTTSGGVNLWLGNNPAADGVNCFLFGPLDAVVDEVSSQARDPVAADALFRQRTFAFWRAEPRRAAGLLWKKFLWTFSNRELPNTGDIEWQTGHSWLFRPPMILPGFGVVLPLALAGALLLGRDWRRATSLLAPLAIGLGTSVVLFTNARFRMPMVPALIVLAAVTLDRLPGLIRTWRQCVPTVVGAGAATAVGIVVAAGDFYGVHAYRIPQITVNTGVLEREAGDPSAAVRDLRAGLAATPDDGLAWGELGLALEQLGSLGPALDAYLDGLAAAPGDTALVQTAAGFLQRRSVDLSLLRAYRQAATAEERRVSAAALRGALAAPAHSRS